MRAPLLWQQDNPALALPLRIRIRAALLLPSAISSLLKSATSRGRFGFRTRRDPIAASFKEPHRRELGALSTQPHLTPQWKEEVNRRIAAHKSRKGQSSEREEHAGPSLGASRAAEAAARVAARYAKAPSYSQMQAEEARVVVRAAEVATKVALEAQAAAETVLAELHAATQPARGPAVVQPIAPVRKIDEEPAATPQAGVAASPAIEFQVQAPDWQAAPQETPVQQRVFDIRWDVDMPVRPMDKKPAARRVQEEFDLSVEDWWSPAEVGESLRNSPIEVGDDTAEHAKLIQFPRELVAARKMRPRLAEGVADGEPQLSIFEVDPGTISTEVAIAAEQVGATSTWTGMRLDHQPSGAPAADNGAVPATDALPVASFGVRLMATVVDCALILACFGAAGFLAAHQFQNPPVGKPAELLGLAALATIGLLYYGMFFALPVGTPGMKYAGIGLCTFDNQIPTRAQLRRRLVAMLLSLLPVGLGLVWSVFDEDHLSWHDRFSKTYLRKL